MLKPKYTAQWRGFFSEAPTSASGRQRPFNILPVQWPLSRAQPTFKTLEISNSDGSKRRRSQSVYATHPSLSLYYAGVQKDESECVV